MLLMLPVQFYTLELVSILIIHIRSATRNKAQSVAEEVSLAENCVSDVRGTYFVLTTGLHYFATPPVSVGFWWCVAVAATIAIISSQTLQLPAGKITRRVSTNRRTELYSDSKIPLHIPGTVIKNRSNTTEHRCNTRNGQGHCHVESNSGDSNVNQYCDKSNCEQYLLGSCKLSYAVYFKGRSVTVL